MLTNTALFELVINNNYDEIASAIQFNRVNFKAKNRRSNYILEVAIEYRSIECFDLIVDNIPESEKISISEAGLYKAIKYYSAAPNNKNKYFIDKLLSKNNIDFNYTSSSVFVKNINIFNLFSDYILSNEPEKYLVECFDMDFEVYNIIFNHCLANNLLNDTIVKKIIFKSIYHKREEILILIKNTDYINNIWNLYPEVIDKIFKNKMSNSLLKYFINLYNTQKPANINPINILSSILNYEMDMSRFGSYSGYYYSKKEFINFINNFKLILVIDYNYDNNLSNLINNKINELVTEPWKKKSITSNGVANVSFTYTISCVETITYFVTLLLLLIKRIPTFELDISSIDNEFITRIKTEKDKSTKVLLCGLKNITNELIKLNKSIPDQLNFIKNDNQIISLNVITNKI